MKQQRKKRSLIGNNRPILALNAAWRPTEWLSVDDAISAYAKGLVTGEPGEVYQTVRGGIQRAGHQSMFEVNSIIAITGPVFDHHVHGRKDLSREALLSRDKNCCAYCLGVFKDEDLTLEHIHPESRGGETSWMNLVAACAPCNTRKRNRTPEEAGMPLMYLPYVPNLFERFILMKRNIREDQMEYLMRGVSSQSRLLLAA